MRFLTMLVGQPLRLRGALIPASIAIALLTCLCVSAQSSREIQVSAGAVWTDSGIDVKVGDTLRFTAAGTLQYDNSKPCGPEGLPRAWTDLIRQLPVNDYGRGTLVGRIGDSVAARAFYIGPQAIHHVVISGRLFLGINQGSADRADGSYKVKVEHTAAPVSSTPAQPVRVPPFPQKLLDSIPTRVVDELGNQGDRVNFILVGSQDKVQEAFRAAGWVTVDRSDKEAVLRGLFASLSKEAYVTLPMSTLTLFGRPQDYAYAQGDPVSVVATRHHFRIWKAPFTLEGRTVWAGAGTHDIGFDRDQRNGHITHKIDPDTDKEREYIAASLQQTGIVAKVDYMAATNPVKEAKTAHGESFHSDGRTVVIYLQDDSSNVASAFADLFCSVLKQKNPDGGEWGGCENYIDGGGKSDLKLGPIPSKYRVEIVPGLMSSCFADSPAFAEGQASLRDKYGITAELIAVPNNSSEDNAKLIAQTLRDKWKSDQRKFIVLGYSKGAPDLHVALATQNGLSSMVAAAVSVAGAVSGSPVVDALPATANRWIQQYNLPSCKGTLPDGFKSLQRSVRQAFVDSYPSLGVPAYSIVAISDRQRTSKSLLETWQLLATYGSVEDGQLLREDAIFPGAKYLGAALADHFAIAFPFDKSNDSAIKAGMDKNRYPRAALLEAIVRFVIQDLDGGSLGVASR
jgi:hypothetical protein